MLSRLSYTIFGCWTAQSNDKIVWKQIIEILVAVIETKFKI